MSRRSTIGIDPVRGQGFLTMLAGRRPFRGEREQAVIYSILNERPHPLRELRPVRYGKVEVSEGVVDAIR